jgi:hypothetical protein
MKVAELTGALLDYWVAKAEGIPEHGWRPPYSGDWAHGGPIIERDGIGFFGGDNSWTAGIDLFANLEWGDPVIRGEHLHYGSTPLEAAMRTRVASKFGDEVPDSADHVRVTVD